MVKCTLSVLLCGFSLLLPGCGVPQDLPDQEIAGFAVPWAAIYDEARDAYLVSDVDGDALAKDGRAAIWRLRPDGAQCTAWIRGGVAGVELHAPKGLALQGDLLYCCDLDRVRTFDRNSGAARGEIVIPGATALEGASAGPQGEVWVTDPASNSVHAIAKDGTVRRIAQSAELHQPAALVVLATGAYVVTRGSGEFVQVDGKGRSTQLVVTPPRSLDGLARVREGQWMCASRTGNTVYALDTKGGLVEWPMAGLQSPMAISVDPVRGRLLVPSSTGGKLLVRRIPQ